MRTGPLTRYREPEKPGRSYMNRKQPFGIGDRVATWGGLVAQLPLVIAMVRRREIRMERWLS
jgi:hypothetical protein